MTQSSLEKRRWAVLSCALCSITLTGVTGCIETGAQPVELPLFLAGTQADTAFDGRDGFSVRLSSAQIAFGPLTLCAGATAASLCETAHAEWQGSAVVDALDPTPKRAGKLLGIGGPVRSWMYDLGFVSLLTQEEPIRTKAALQLGHSVYLEGTATDGSTNVHFVAELDVSQEVETERGVPVVSKTISERFEQDLAEPDLDLLVRFDPRSWFAQVDFAAATSELDCSERCELEFEDGDQGYRALHLAIVAGEHPTFSFDHLAKR